jgi:hypothetical protein
MLVCRACGIARTQTLAAASAAAAAPALAPSAPASRSSRQQELQATSGELHTQPLNLVAAAVSLQPAPAPQSSGVARAASAVPRKPSKRSLQLDSDSDSESHPGSAAKEKAAGKAGRSRRCGSIAIGKVTRAQARRRPLRMTEVHNAAPL